MALLLSVSSLQVYSNSPSFDGTCLPASASFEMATKHATDDTSRLAKRQHLYPRNLIRLCHLSNTGSCFEARPNLTLTVAYTETHRRGLYKFPHGRLHQLPYEALLAYVSQPFLWPRCEVIHRGAEIPFLLFLQESTA